MTTVDEQAVTDLKARARRASAASPAAPALSSELNALCRRMRLPYLRAAAPDVIATAKAQRWDPAEVLRVLLAEEVLGRDQARRRERLRRDAAREGISDVWEIVAEVSSPDGDNDAALRQIMVDHPDLRELPEQDVRIDLLGGRS